MAPRLGESLPYQAGQWSFRIDRVRLLADRNQGQHSLRCVCADPEPEPAAPGCTHEVRPVQAEEGEDGDRHLDADRRRVGRGSWGLSLFPCPRSIDVGETELFAVGLQ